MTFKAEQVGHNWAQVAQRERFLKILGAISSRNLTDADVLGIDHLLIERDCSIWHASAIWHGNVCHCEPCRRNREALAA